MKDFTLEATQCTPNVKLSFDEATAELGGACYPEDASSFFHPIMDWLEEFRRARPKSLTMNVRLDYFNTSSSKCLLDLFITMEEMTKEGCDTKIRWHYCEDDEDILESGEEFAEDLDVKFEFVAY